MAILRPLVNGSVDVETDGSAGGSSLLRATASINFVGNTNAQDSAAVAIPAGAQVVGLRLLSIDNDAGLGILPTIVDAGYSFYVVTIDEGNITAQVSSGYDDPASNAFNPSSGPFVVYEYVGLVATIGNADGTEGGAQTLNDLATADEPMNGIQVMVLYYIP
jgi:hypothetical protein